MDYKKLAKVADSINYEPAEGYMAAPDKLFASIGKKEGVEVTKSQGNTSVGKVYERRDGRVWTLANLYTVKYGDKELKFDIACLSNEGWDPSSKTGWSEDASGKKWYVGKSFGWILNNGPKETWREISNRIKEQLKRIGL